MKNFMPVWFALCSLGVGCVTQEDERVSTQTQLGLGNNPTEAQIKALVDGVVGNADPQAVPRRHVALSVVVIVNGTKHFYHYGETYDGSGVAPNNDTIYQIASLSKTFTGTMLSKLHWDNKLDWHDLLTDHISQNLTGGRQQITLRHLGLHEAGLTKDNPGSNASNSTGTYVGDMNKLKDSLLVCNTTFPCIPPDGDELPHHYSNWGYQVLSAVLADSMTTTVPVLYKKDIFAPRGMTSTGYKDGLVETSCLASGTHCTFSDYGNCTYVAACHYSFNHRVAPGYHRTSGVAVLSGDGQGTDKPAAFGSGTVWSTTSDMAKWLAFQMNAEGTNTATEERYLASAQLPRTVDGVSFFSDHATTAGGSPILIKSGDSPDQYKSGLAFTEDRKVGVVVLSNFDPVSAKEIARSIVGGIVD